MGVTTALVAILFAQAIPDGPGKELVEAVCTACHSTERIAAKQFTKAEWQDKVLEMLQEDPDVTQMERDTIVAYLARTFPRRVNVNTAAAKDLEAVLEISSKDAAAIVAYREDKGSFKTAEDVKKVPGVDAAKIESARARLEF